jgi:small subunit ribosomal protein S13
MARISGIDLPRDKRIETALTYIYGIGETSAQQILEVAGISPDTRVRDLSEADAARLREIVERDYRVEGDLRREVNASIKRLVEIGSYRGVRHRAACRFAASAPRPTHALARAPRRLWA